jgi:hypothetical protein
VGRAVVEVGFLERLPGGRLRERVACAVRLVAGPAGEIRAVRTGML